VLAGEDQPPSMRCRAISMMRKLETRNRRG
jgi:hypothetical protein